MRRSAIVVRGLAGLAALVMVVGAFAVRGDRDGDSGGETDSARADQIVCPSDLRTACTEAVAERNVALATASAGTTADALIAATDDAGLDGDAWIVPAAWARAVIDERARLGRAPLFVASDPLVSTSVSLAIWDSRAAELADDCPVVDWSCLAVQTGTALANGDRVSTGVPDVDSGLGLPLAAAQIATLVGTGEYASNDFDAIATATARLAQGQRDDPLGAMRAQGPGRLTAVAVVDADARSLSSNFGPITLVTNSPAVRVDLVAFTAADRPLAGSLRDALIDAFVGAGWRVADEGDTPDGLPAGGVLAAVRSLWNQR